MTHRKDLGDMAEDFRERFMREVTAPLDEVAITRGSPLERALFWALMNQAERHHVPYAFETSAESMPWLPGAVRDQELWLVHLETAGGFFTYEIVPQLTVSVEDRLHRLDFAVGARCAHAGWNPSSDGISEHASRVTYAVECDGHDFDGRSQEQAERHRTRDRDLQSIGWNVARFTRAEVHRDPEAAAKRALGFGEQLLARITEK